jgi:hypothetical protein
MSNRRRLRDSACPPPGRAVFGHKPTACLRTRLDKMYALSHAG